MRKLLPKVPSILLFLAAAAAFAVGEAPLAALLLVGGTVFLAITDPKEKRISAPANTNNDHDENTAGTTNDSAVGRSREDENKR